MIESVVRSHCAVCGSSEIYGTRHTSNRILRPVFLFRNRFTLTLRLVVTFTLIQGLNASCFDENRIHYGDPAGSKVSCLDVELGVFEFQRCGGAGWSRLPNFLI